MMPVRQMLAIVVLTFAGSGTLTIVHAREERVWYPPAAPDDVKLESEEMVKWGVVKIVGQWRDGNINSGAGIMLGDDQGDLYLMTAAHLVRNPRLGSARKVSVYFFKDISGKEYDAKILRYDQATDFAVLKLPAFYEERILDRLVKYPLDPAFSGAIGGQTIKAIGHPGDNDWRVSHGKTLASKQPGQISLSAGMTAEGNSGGPLLSSENRLVGMVTGGEGEFRDIGITVTAIVPLLERWRIPYRMRVVESIETVIEQLRRALWEDDWASIMGEMLEDGGEHTSVNRGRVSLLASKKSIVVRWFGGRSYLEILSTHRSKAIVDEAWRVWLRAIVSAIGPGYTVHKYGPRRIAFYKYKGFAWPSSRRVTFELWEWDGTIYFHAFQFDPAHGDSESGRMNLATYYRKFLK